MGIDIGGATIATSGSGIALNSALVFNASGHGAFLSPQGYMGSKTGATLYYSAVTGWEINTALWQSNLNTTNGVFTCPVAGYYAMGYNAIHRGGSNSPAGLNTYGYAGFAKNGALSYFIHWNLNHVTNAWGTGGTSALFQCAAGDTLALFVNRSPSPAGPDVISQNYGVYPDTLNVVWCKRVG